MKKLNIGIVGVGYWGPNFARIITELQDANLTWCCDINKDTLEKFKNKFPAAKVTTKLNDLLKDDDLDAVIVVTPAQKHYKIIKKILESGKDVLSEKPLTVRASQSEELVKLAKKKKRILMVDHTFIYNTAVRKLKEMIKSGKLGKIFYLYGLYNALGPIRKDVSSMWDLPHFIYVATHLLGKEPRYITAFGRDFLKPSTEDLVFLTLEFDDNVIFNLSCSWIDPVKIRRLVVVGDKKMAVFDDTNPEERLKVFDKGVDVKKSPDFADLQMIMRNGDILIPRLENKEPLKEVAIDFLNSVRKRKQPTTPGKDGYNLVKILEAAQKSLKSGGKKVKITKN